MTLLDIVRREVERAVGRSRNVVRKAVITVGTKASYYLQATGAGADVFDDIELWQHYGFTSMPPVGGEALVVCASGAGEGGIVVATQDRSHRPALAATEVAMYGPKATGQATVTMRASGDVDLVPSTGKTVNVGGSTEALLLGDSFKAKLDALSVAVNALGVAVGPDAAVINGMKVALVSFTTGTAALLATKGKVA